MFHRLKLIKNKLKPSTIAVFLLLLLFVPASIYVINPYEIKSDSIRARIFGHDIYRIPSQSMLPSLQPGDYVLVSNTSYLNSTPKRGEVIVFEASQKNKSKNVSRFIKRVIAIGGDRIEIKDAKVVINGIKLSENYVKPGKSKSRYSQYMPEVFIPKNKVFVLGDNRDNSNDSRKFGLIDHDAIIGKATYILFGKDSRRGDIK